MRIAQIMLARGFGGAERSFFDISESLASIGHNVAVIVDSRSMLFPRLAANKSLLVIPIKCRGVWDFFAGYRIKIALAKFDAQIVHVHLARSAYLGGKAARALRIPSLVKTHNLVNLKYYKSVDHFVPTTQFQAEYLLENGVPKTRITKIPNFTRLQPVDSVTPSHKKGPIVIRAVGRFVYKKGFDTLIAAFEAILKQRTDVRLEIGGSGRELAKLSDQVVQHGLQKEVKFCGWIEDIQSFVEGADLFVIPSRDEPFGIVALESMACGVPIVTSRTQGPTEILTDEMAYFFEPGDALGLSEQILMALSSARRWGMAQVALEKLKQTYTQEQVVKRYELLYKQII